jgi:hypothetical protein
MRTPTLTCDPDEDVCVCVMVTALANMYSKLVCEYFKLGRELPELFACWE